MQLETRNKIKQLIIGTIKDKIEKYKAETHYKPFFSSIFDDDDISLTSKIHSMYTSFGISIYEQLSLILAEASGYEAKRHVKLLGSINNDTQLLINRLCDNEIETFSKLQEIDKIRMAIVQGNSDEHPYSTVDVFLKDPESNCITLIDITTAKMSKKSCRALRRKLLDWTALALSQNPDIDVNTYIGVPYNPYYPKDYSRPFVKKNCHEDEVLVQNDLWKLFAGYDVFNDLLEIFREVGEEMHSEIRSFLDQAHLEVDNEPTT